MPTFEGGCACGAVRYRLEREPLIVHCCHCTRCQTETGSAFALNAVIEASAVSLLAAQPEGNEVPTDSGRAHTAFRCPDCKVAVWHVFAPVTYLRYVPLGTLDDKGALTPDVQIYTRSRLPFVPLMSDIPVFESFYDMKSVWSPDAQARRKAASEAAKAAHGGN